MRTFIPWFISLTGIFIIATAAVVLPLPAEAVARHSTYRSFSLVQDEGDNNSPVHIGATDLHDSSTDSRTIDIVVCSTLLVFLFLILLFQNGAQSLHFSSLDLDSTSCHTTSTSMGSSTITTGSLMTSFTFASPHPTPGSLSFAPEAQNMRLVLRPAGLLVRSSSSSMDLTTTKTISTLHSMGGALGFDVASATPSPSSTPSHSSGIVAYVILSLLCLLLICVCVILTRRVKSCSCTPTVSSGTVLRNITAGSSSQAATSALTPAAEAVTPANSPIAPDPSSSSAGPKITPEAYVNSSPSSSSTARATTGH